MKNWKKKNKTQTQNNVKQKRIFFKSEKEIMPVSLVVWNFGVWQWDWPWSIYEPGCVLLERC